MRTDTSLLPSAQVGREYADFFLALSAAFQRCQIYPGGHPTVDRAVDQVVRRLAPLLTDRTTVAFAVTPTQLSVGAAATDPEHALLRELAGRLFRRNVGAVRIAPGVTRAEVTSLLEALGQDQVISAPPPSSHVAIEPLNFDGLALTPASDGTGTVDGRPRIESVWADLARAMLDQSSAIAVELGAEELVRAFEAAPADPVRDAAVLERLTAAAVAYREVAPPDAAVMRRQVTGLLRGLKPETLERLLAVTHGGAGHRAVLHDLLNVAGAPAAMELLLAASRMEHRTLSPALVQLLTKLASHAEHGPARSRQLADEQFQAALKALIEEWHDSDGTDAEVSEYDETLDHLPAPLVPDLDPTEAYRSDPLRIVTMHLDMAEVDAPVNRAVRTMVARGRIRPLVDLLCELPPAESLAKAFHPLVATPDALMALLAERPTDLATLERLAPEVGTAAIPVLLDALSDSEERTVRRRLIELLARFGNAVTPYALSRLPDAPWFVRRNLLRLLQVVPDPPAEAVASGYALDPDSRVRVEGLRLLLRLPAARTRGIVQGLADADAGCVRVAVQAAVEGCPPAAAAPLLRRMKEHSLEPELRPVAIRALAPLEDEPGVVALLLRVAAWRLPILGLVVAPRSRESLAALSGLARHWRWHPRTARLLARAERHRDPVVRAAVSGPTVFEQLGLILPTE